MKQRMITAIVAMLFFIPIVIYGQLPFTLLIYLLATIAILELIKMNQTFSGWFPTILAILFIWFLLIPNVDVLFPNMWFTKMDSMILFVMLLLAYSVLSKNKFTFNHAGFLLIASFYVGMGFYFLNQTRMEGLNYMLFTLFVIWATDTGAYFFGRAFGKHKLWPTISPKKTIEGAIGGIISACIVGISFHLIYPFEHSFWMIVLVTILVSMVGQLGDLVESAYKRYFGVKDSGNILPGHGGILDRFDSLLFVVPFLHLIHFIS